MASHRLTGLTRLAPSPTGALHLGNARTFLLNWLLARQRGWRILLRVEDLDGPRVKSGADRLAIEDLRWLGLDWDDGPVYQSPRQARYACFIDDLLRRGLAYPCACSRKEVERSASAPHAEDGAAVYPGTCRGRFATMQEALAASADKNDHGRNEGGKSAGPSVAVRFRVEDQIIEWIDAFRGSSRCNPGRELGDFVIAKIQANATSIQYQAAYQLAVVVDDVEAGVSEVIRGDDLIDSTPRQILVHRALGWADRIPRYWHLPLVIGPDGRRLAKRHGDTRVSYYRERGVSPGRLRALLARWSGLPDVGNSISIESLLRDFNINALPRDSIIFQSADDQWLRNDAH